MNNYQLTIIKSTDQLYTHRHSSKRNSHTLLHANIDIRHKKEFTYAHTLLDAYTLQVTIPMPTVGVIIVLHCNT